MTSPTKSTDAQSRGHGLSLHLGHVGKLSAGAESFSGQRQLFRELFLDVFEQREQNTSKSNQAPERREKQTVSALEQANDVTNNVLLSGFVPAPQVQLPPTPVNVSAPINPNTSSQQGSKPAIESATHQISKTSQQQTSRQAEAKQQQESRHAESRNSLNEEAGDDADQSPPQQAAGEDQPQPGAPLASSNTTQARLPTATANAGATPTSALAPTTNLTTEVATTHIELNAKAQSVDASVATSTPSVRAATVTSSTDTQFDGNEQVNVTNPVAQALETSAHSVALAKPELNTTSSTPTQVIASNLSTPADAPTSATKGMAPAFNLDVTTSDPAASEGLVNAPATNQVMQARSTDNLPMQGVAVQNPIIGSTPSRALAASSNLGVNAVAATSASVGSDAAPVESNALSSPGPATPTASFAYVASSLPVATGTSASTRIHAPLGSPAFTPELGQKVVWMIGRQLSQADIRIQPEALGPIQINIQMRGNEAVISVSASDPQAQALLNQSLSSLRDSLGQNGIQVQSLQVQDSNQADLSNGQSGSSSQNPQQSAFGQSSPGSRDSRNADATNPGGGEADGVGTTPGAPSPSLRPDSNRQVDTFA